MKKIIPFIFPILFFGRACASGQEQSALTGQYLIQDHPRDAGRVARTMQNRRRSSASIRFAAVHLKKGTRQIRADFLSVQFKIPKAQRR